MSGALPRGGVCFLRRIAEEDDEDHQHGDRAPRGPDPDAMPVVRDRALRLRERVQALRFSGERAADKISHAPQNELGSNS